MFDPMNSSVNINDAINDLYKNKWIDLNTRLVTLEFTIYNGNINLFSQIK